MKPRLINVLTLVLTPVVLCAATNGSCNTSNERVGPSTGEVVGVGVAAVAVVAAVIIIPIEVNKSHHTLKGCVLSTPAGLELRTTDNKTFALSGTTTDIAAGNTLRLHGNHQKHSKDTAGDQVFLVQKMQKNYGPCQALAQPAPPTAAHS
ncbi:MAG TPA: hypothetical protein VGM11_02280 [Acidobacteriaceae bacterium]|jgi:hypothetical protein